MQASRVVPALPSDPRVRKLMKRQENDQTQIPNQSGYDAIHFHRLDGNKNRLRAKGKSRKKMDEQGIPDLSVACRQDLGVRMFDILSDSRRGGDGFVAVGTL